LWPRARQLIWTLPFLVNRQMQVVPRVALMGGLPHTPCHVWGLSQLLSPSVASKLWPLLWGAPLLFCRRRQHRQFWWHKTLEEGVLLHVHHSHHYSRRAVLHIDMPYMIQRSLCVTNGHLLLQVWYKKPLWLSQTHRASWANIQSCCVA
jgi:hypothetical protein